MRCNEADECTMGAAGAKAVIEKVAAARGRGGNIIISSARGQQFIRARTSTRMACNEADECSMSTAGARVAVEKVAKARGRGGNIIISNARGKEMLPGVKASTRMACNEADECSMGTAGARALWQKAAASVGRTGNFAERARLRAAEELLKQRLKRHLPFVE